MDFVKLLQPSNEHGDLILVGGGGHCKACIDVIADGSTPWNIAGIIEKAQLAGTDVLGYPVIGTDDDIPALSKKFKNFFISLGQGKTAALRKSLFMLLRELQASIPTIVAPDAYVSKFVGIGAGTIIMHRATLNIEVTIGENCIINTGAILDHEAKIGSHTHISTNAVLNGKAVVGSECFLGSCSVILDRVTVCDNCIIGANSVVIRDISEPGTYVGNPVRKIG